MTATAPRGPKWAKLYDRQPALTKRALAKVAETRDAPRPTLAQLRELIDAARERGETTIELTLPRFHAPKRGTTIRLMADVDGKTRTGPMSSGDADVKHAGGHNWTTRWRIVDVERWVSKMERGR